MGREVKQLYAWVVRDSAGVEGLLAHAGPASARPMIGPNLSDLTKFRGEAVDAATRMQCSLEIARFARAETVEVARR